MIIDKFLDDVFIWKNNTFFDDRGFFFESFNSNFLEVTNIKNPFVQDNISFSKEKFTLRGLHYQKGKYTQAKLIFLVSGSILDVFVDARPTSKNFGQYGFVKLIILEIAFLFQEVIFMDFVLYKKILLLVTRLIIFITRNQNLMFFGTIVI